MKKIIQTLLLVFLCLIAKAQHHKGHVEGRILSADGQPASFVPVGIKGTKHGTTTDEQGKFRFHAPEGKHILLVQFVGHEPEEREIEVKEGQTISLPDFMLRETAHELHEVEILGKTEVQEVKESSYNVTAIDAKPLHNSTLDINQVLNKVSGVRIREAGGLGSSFNFSLNGFSGSQVKFFVDGIPMDNFGSSFQLNNIPVNLAERIEVYKGVVPIWLGSDALGGAVNVITSNRYATYLDASYSYGSFNTHKSMVNTGYTSKKGLTLQLNLFQNFSDNNYWVNVEAADINTGAYFKSRRLRRFNDQYHNETAIVYLGVVGKKYADRLLLGITLGQNRAEIQTGARMVSVFGQYHRLGNIVMPSLKYQKKDLFVKGLDVTFNANFNLGQEQNVDTVARRYNWLQQYTQNNGAERSRSLYKYRNNNGLVMANLNYQFFQKHTLTVNNVYNTFNRRGADELFPENDSYEQPRINVKNVLGIGYKYDYNKRWSTTLFVKQFYQQNRYATSYNPVQGSSLVAYRKQKTAFDRTGFGLASTFFILKNLQVKGSFEKSYRLPGTDELFGDQVNLDGNILLRPETSNNINFGVSYHFNITKAHHVVIDGNVLNRNAMDFIRPMLNSNQTKQVNANLDKVTNQAFDMEIKYSYKESFTMGGNASYQNLRDNSEMALDNGELVKNFHYNDRIPNMPFLFGNGYASLTFRNIGNKSNTLSVGYNLLYVHAYYLYWPSMGTSEDKYGIQMQLSHDANVVFSFAEGKYNIALESKNMLDSQLYDNFSLQKPSRAFYIKLRYFISKK